MRKILEGLLEYVLADPVRNTRDSLLMHARQLHERFPF
jgi:hypothetical protein